MIKTVYYPIYALEKYVSTSFRGHTTTTRYNQKAAAKRDDLYEGQIVVCNFVFGGQCVARIYKIDGKGSNRDFHAIILSNTFHYKRGDTRELNKTLVAPASDECGCENTGRVEYTIYEYDDQSLEIMPLKQLQEKIKAKEAEKSAGEEDERQENLCAECKNMLDMKPFYCRTANNVLVYYSDPFISSIYVDESTTHLRFCETRLGVYKDDEFNLVSYVFNYSTQQIDRRPNPNCGNAICKLMHENWSPVADEDAEKLLQDQAEEIIKKMDETARKTLTLFEGETCTSFNDFRTVYNQKYVKPMCSLTYKYFNDRRSDVSFLWKKYKSFGMGANLT